MQGPPSANAERRGSVVMRDEVSGRLLRGVRIERALEGFGVHWAASVAFGKWSPEKEHAISEPVPRLDDFLSHDWATGRWRKFIALSFVYNSEAAVVVSIAVGLLIAVLTASPVAVVPKVGDHCELETSTIGGVTHEGEQSHWCMGMCPATFIAVLLSWQCVSRKVRRPRFVFLDKMCINQTVEEEKKAGITALAGFLRNTDRLVVLWSPVYFQRLWCVYEVASWYHLHGDSKKSLYFMPVALAGGVLVMMLAVFLFFTLVRITWCADNGASYSMMVVCLIASSGPLHVFRKLARDQLALPRLLDDFNVRTAECFCCSANHVHPETGQTLPCDRTLVCATLGLWVEGAPGGHAPAEDSEAVAIDRFNRKVRTQVKEAVSKQIGMLGARYRHLLVTAVPTVWYACDTVSSMPPLPPQAFARLVGFYADLFLCCVPSVLKLVFVATWLLESIAPARARCRVLDAASTLGLTVVMAGVAYALWVSVYFTLLLESPVPQVGLHLVHAGLTVLLFWAPPLEYRPLGRRPADGATDELFN